MALPDPTPVEALRARGAEVGCPVLPDEGHDFVNPENLITASGAAERFLARHPEGRSDRADRDRADGAALSTTVSHTHEG
ncbi:hypothetical protein HFP72_18765 [Nocardiopsis sp. ARC36]